MNVVSGLRWRDPRVLLGLAITALTLYWALRGVDFGELARDIGRADLRLLILPSALALIGQLGLRGLRWRHLVQPVAPVARGPVFRAVAVGFMANNVFPLRLGEVIRAWYLGRETGIPSASVFGTVIVERMIDAAVVLGLAALVLGAGGAEAAGIDVAKVLPPLAAVAMVPLAMVAALRVAPERVIGLSSRIAAPVLPEALNARIALGFRRMAEGLAALKGGRHLAWIALHSILIWGVAAVFPFWIAIQALGIDLGSTTRELAASYTLLVVVGAAVALPSAPGFFGPYHAACWLALRPFGVEKSLAIALGTLSHAVFWVTITGFGLLVLRFHRTSLDEIEEVAAHEAAEPEPRSSGQPPAAR